MTTWDFTPTCRGFDYFYGFYGPAQDYYTHESGGLDLRENFNPVTDAAGIYSTNLYSEKASRGHPIPQHPNSVLELTKNGVGRGSCYWPVQERDAPHPTFVVARLFTPQREVVPGRADVAC